ncbi:HD domain-containing protein [Ancylomarina longa]|nr:HD domain-containing protein [Ancylomarina longa]
MQQNNNFIEEVEKYVGKLLEKLPAELCYHNLKHTLEVVEASKNLAVESGLSAEHTEIVIIAAWFHDCGHTITYFGHEEAGMEIAKNFLNKIEYPSDHTQEVLRCIACTKYPSQPQNEMQKVLCDADMFHLTFDDYEYRSMKLKEELEAVTHKEIPFQHWCDTNLEFLEDHCYFTNYGKKILTFFKESNLKKFLHDYCNH